jgi:flavodoxin
MKTVVVFYSLDGNCALVAEKIKTQLNADLLRLYTTKDKKRSFIGNLFWGCGMVFFKKKPTLKPYSFDPAVYDLIIFGAPVWADHPAPPLKTFISEAGITGKKIALFLCHAGGKGTSMKRFRTMLSGNDIISEVDFNNPAKKYNEDVKQQIEDWLKGTDFNINHGTATQG